MKRREWEGGWDGGDGDDGSGGEKQHEKTTQDR